MLVGILLIILFFAHHWLFSLIIIGLIVYSIQTKKRRFVDRPQTSRTNFGGRRDISDEAEQSDVK
ncbi:methyl-accepting chemotaxis sensory transducer [Fructobacillus ficulneus]|uniref:Methyl-accepting chemotaxis sensory transducer n=2 Tax=Fructobacillus ficulneus TaxID=157463 RepID=A0A0K8MHT8_9LACO|nr:methyl-accepting chemotaxis sensory transducer [Fructobacillus ficulneus]